MTEPNYEELLSNLEDDFIKKQKFWNRIIDDLTKRLSTELKTIIDLNAEAISQRQILVEERTQYYFKLYKDIPKLKQLKKNHFEFYSTKYPIKINGTEKTKLIEADTAYHDAKLEYVQNYINFLSESIKSVDNVIYAIKNKIELYNISGLD